MVFYKICSQQISEYNPDGENIMWKKVYTLLNRDSEGNTRILDIPDIHFTFLEKENDIDSASVELRRPDYITEDWINLS